MAKLVPRDRKVIPVQQVHKGRKAKLDLLARLAPPVTLDRRVLKVIPARQVRLALRVNKARQDQLAHRVHKAR